MTVEKAKRLAYPTLEDLTVEQVVRFAFLAYERLPEEEREDVLREASSEKSA